MGDLAQLAARMGQAARTLGSAAWRRGAVRDSVSRLYRTKRGQIPERTGELADSLCVPGNAQQRVHIQGNERVVVSTDVEHAQYVQDRIPDLTPQELASEMGRHVARVLSGSREQGGTP